MIRVSFNTTTFMKEMNSIMGYSIGFLEGAQAGRRELLETIGEKTVQFLNEFIDSNARVNPSVLHHIYEWNQEGTPGARLFDLNYSASAGGLSVNATFRQSTSVQQGSKTPFYDKARIMEEGVPVTIRPTKSSVLAFEDDGEQVFTKGPVTVRNPGGPGVAGGLQKTVETFFSSYWKQSFLQSTGIAEALRRPTEFAQGFPQSKVGGKSRGYDAGYRWISAMEAR